MKIAKPSEQDIEAALELMQILNSVDSNWFPSHDDDEKRPLHFDDTDPEHLAYFYLRVKQCLAKGPGFPGRVIGGMYTIMTNNVLDPNADCLALHPTIVAALEAMPDPYTVIHEAQRTAPTHIWLQHGEDAYAANETFPSDHGGVTWASDNIHGVDIPYVREDLAKSFDQDTHAMLYTLLNQIVNDCGPMSEWGGQARALMTKLKFEKTVLERVEVDEEDD